MRQSISYLLLTTVFGLAAGAVGAMLAQSYLIDDSFSVPFFGAIDVSDARGGGVIIRDPRKVVVEQNDMVAETIRNAAGSLIGIHPRQPVAAPEKVATTTAISTRTAYRLDKASTTGFILTSDGWIVAMDIPEDVSAALTSKRPADLTKALNGLVAIGSDRRPYDIDRVLPSPLPGYWFWHIKATGLGVRRFLPVGDLTPGSLMVAVNGNGWGAPATLSAISGPAAAVVSSDEYSAVLSLSPAPAKNLHPAFIFALGGDLAGVIGADGVARPVGSLSACISCLLKGKPLVRPWFGVRYADLERIYDPALSLRLGALITADDAPAVAPGSPAAKAGFRAGDIIMAVNNIEVRGNNTLSALIGTYSPGEAVDIRYERNGSRQNVSVTLGELKPDLKNRE